MSTISTCRISNGSVVLDALSIIDSSGVPKAVAIVPGLAETAEDWRQLIEQLVPIPAAAVTLRGRGSSSRPAAGYSLTDHASDIDAFVQAIPAAKVVLVAFSRSVAYALEYASTQPQKLAGLALLDYPPRHTALSLEWPEGFAKSVWRGRRAEEVLNIATLKAIQADAVAKDLTPLLSMIAVPTLVIRAGQPGAVLSEEDAETYRTLMPSCEVVEFEWSTHALWEPNPFALSQTLARFAGCM